MRKMSVLFILPVILPPFLCIITYRYYIIILYGIIKGASNIKPEMKLKLSVTKELSASYINFNFVLYICF